MLKEAGFTEVELVADTGFNSSPVTKGVLFRALKPATAADAERDKAAMEAADKTT